MTKTSNHPGAFPAPGSTSHRTRNLVIIGAVAVVLIGGTAAVVMANRTQQSTAESVAGVSSVIVEIDSGTINISTAGDDKVGIRTTLSGFSDGLPVADTHLENGALSISSACPPASMNCYVDDVLAIPAGIPIRIRTTTGTVAATDLDVPDFDVQSRTGEVTASFVRPPDRIAIAVATGSIDVTVPAGDYRFTARTSTGDVRSDIQHDPTAPRSMQLSNGTGDITVTAS